MRILFAFIIFFSAGLAGAQAQTENRWGKIVESKTVKIAYRADATPYSFVDKNEPTGYTIDLCKLVVESMGRQIGSPLKIEWVQVNTQTRFSDVASGKADMECGASTITLGRMKEVDFSNPMFIETTGVLVKANSGITGAAGLAGKKIAVAAGTTNERALAGLVSQGKLKATLVPVKDREEGIAALEKGTADAYASDKLLLLGAKISQPGSLSMLADDLSLEPYGIVLARGDANLRLAVNTGLAQIFKSEKIVEIFNKWFGQIGLRPSGIMLTVFTLGAMPE